MAEAPDDDVEERARRVLSTVDVTTEKGYERARRALEAVAANASRKRCMRHGRDLVRGETRSWCEACLSDLAGGPLESDGMLGRNLEETGQRLMGMVELRNYIRLRRRA